MTKERVNGGAGVQLKTQTFHRPLLYNVTPTLLKASLTMRATLEATDFSSKFS